MKWCMRLYKWIIIQFSRKKGNYRKCNSTRSDTSEEGGKQNLWNNHFVFKITRYPFWIIFFFFGPSRHIVGVKIKISRKIMHILCRTRIQFCVSYIDYWMLAWVQLTLGGKRDDCSIANDEGQVCLDIFGSF